MKIIGWNINGLRGKSMNLFSDNEPCYDKFTVGDPIIIKKNDSNKDIHNGDEGIILYCIGEYDYKIFRFSKKIQPLEFLVPAFV